MKFNVVLCLLFVSAFVFSVPAQQEEKPALRPRVIETDEPVKKVVVITDSTKNLPSKPQPTTFRVPAPVKETSQPVSQPNSNGSARISFAQIRSMIEEAKREMQSRPILTGSVDSYSLVEVVKLAFYDWNQQHIDFVVVPKEMFLSTSKDLVTISSKGKGITVRTIRGNGVNTPVMIFDDKNFALLPLLVQYPRENNGILQNVAFYISTHPGLVTPEVVNAGKLYVRNTIDIARENLRKKGLYISPQVADMAERLAVVEHIDHWRFRNEYHPNVFNDVFALFALNEGDTYKYSVSSAGAGGMVQMIPSTYRMMRARYPQVDLMPDFVEGMRDHVNASQAMLLYIQMTWNDLTASETVNEALRSGIATPTELMSAGYNSNPARLPGYIKRGGPAWKQLIPRETKIYLEINESFDKHFPYIPRTK